MVRKITLASIIVLLPSLACAEGNDFWEIRLPFEKATIEYAISGIENGEETLYIKEHGNSTARYRRSVMQVMGIEKVTEVVDFIDPEWKYIYDLRERTGTKIGNPKKYLEEEYNQLSDSDKEQVLKNSKELGIGFLNGGMGGEIEENVTTILGIACDKTQFMGTTMYTIHNSDIALKTETNIMGMVTLIEATSIIKDVAEQRYFQHPQGITAVIDLEADAISRSMAEETILKLNDPEASEKVLLPGATHQLHPAPEEQQDMEKAIEALKNIFEN